MKRSILKIVVAAVVTLAFVACGSNDAKVSGRFVGLNFKMVYLEQMTAAGQSVVDSMELDNNGGYHFIIKDLDVAPSLYNILYGSDRIPLLLSRGEDVEVSALGSALANYTVSGSPESELLREFYKTYLDGQLELHKTSLEYYAVKDDASKKELAQRYNAVYNTIKRNQISFIVENKDCMAAVYALYQRLPSDPYLAGADSDLIYYRTVADAVSKRYPTSSFLVTLSNDIARMEARISLMNSIEYRNSPDLKGKDMYGKEVTLSSLNGNVVLIDFWSAEVGNSNALNADLKEIYERFKSKGFCVYQVSADTSKVAWITAVQEQRLPWISVCDFMGEFSPMLRAYNVRKLPTNYLIDREGRIIAKDIYSNALAARLEAILK